jgi:hypothetical protein
MNSLEKDMLVWNVGLRPISDSPRLNSSSESQIGRNPTLDTNRYKKFFL